MELVPSGKYSSLETANVRIIRWGGSDKAPYFGFQTVEITDPVANTVYNLYVPGSGKYGWIYGWHIGSTMDIRFIIRDTSLSKRIRITLNQYNAWTSFVYTQVPIFGVPTTLSGTNKLELVPETSATGSILVCLFGIETSSSSHTEKV